MSIESYRTEVKHLCKRYTFGSIKPMPCCQGRAHCLVFAIKSDLPFACFIDILIYVVARKCICSCKERDINTSVSFNGEI